MEDKKMVLLGLWNNLFLENVLKENAEEIEIIRNYEHAEENSPLHHLITGFVVGMSEGMKTAEAVLKK